MKASATASLASWRASGPGAESGIPSSRTSGNGSSWIGSVVARRQSSGRRRLARRASSARWVAIEYSYARTDALPRNRLRPRQAASSVSWSRSSASCADPTMR